jgi:Na+-transporting methylmalonyl-CoA/oxaloacetate decarboxylase gamma subunit
MLDALWIVLLGMVIIFAVLGVLLGVMTILSRLPENKKDKKAE